MHRHSPAKFYRGEFRDPSARDPKNMQQPLTQIDLLAPQADQLRDAEAVPVPAPTAGDPDRSSRSPAPLYIPDHHRMVKSDRRSGGRPLIGAAVAGSIAETEPAADNGQAIAATNPRSKSP